MEVYSDFGASNNTRFVCANCLQMLSDVQEQVWAFSIALDGSTHQGLSYLDLRVRFCGNQLPHNPGFVPTNWTKVINKYYAR